MKKKECLNALWFILRLSFRSEVKKVVCFALDDKESSMAVHLAKGTEERLGK